MAGEAAKTDAVDGDGIRETGMRCDICGEEIPNGQETYDTKNELPSRGVFPTRTVRIILCGACGKKRNEREPLLWIAVGILFFVGLAIVVSQLVN